MIFLIMALDTFIILFLSLVWIIALAKLIILIFKNDYQEYKKFKKIYYELNYYKFYKTNYLFLDYNKNDNCIYFDLEFETVRLAKNEFIIKDSYPFYTPIEHYWHRRFQKWFKKNVDFKNIPLHSYDSN